MDADFAGVLRLGLHDLHGFTTLDSLDKHEMRIPVENHGRSQVLTLRMLGLEVYEKAAGTMYMHDVCLIYVRRYV